MRSTFDIDEKLLAQVQELSQARTKREAIEVALREFIRSKRIERARRLIGTDRLSFGIKELKRLRRLD